LDCRISLRRRKYLTQVRLVRGVVQCAHARLERDVQRDHVRVNRGRDLRALRVDAVVHVEEDGAVAVCGADLVWCKELRGKEKIEMSKSNRVSDQYIKNKTMVPLQHEFPNGSNPHSHPHTETCPDHAMSLTLGLFPLFTLTLSSTQRNGNDTIAEQLVECLDLGVDLFAQLRDGAKHGVARQPAAARLGALGLARLEQVLVHDESV
jgi:hypothetical protein